MFSGPHGISAPVDKYKTVLMVASDFGVAAQLPYLKQAVFGRKSWKNRTRRVHLIWQLQAFGIGLAVQSLLNGALDDDTIDQGYDRFSASLYIKLDNAGNIRFGRRATVYKGSADLQQILEEEVSGKYIEAVGKTEEEREKRW
ncbi:hypothetical protein H2201_008941 [Coniosporium apollinis]|uniref:Flavodoxin-like domain-containing protein n=1 Tax=Coniosporium apollinis TaxID=61459 RepID=A0ABQ9NJ32_9PEZI|nr:hypothetical protein H2201_008941 [Coniosporium apollinis]